MKRWILLLCAAGAVAASSCSGKEYLGTETTECPSRAVFDGKPAGGGAPVASVSEFMSRRCGTLDCHGSEYRSMRLYGHFGLRHPQEFNFPGGAKTTQLELDDNYSSVCTLQPEQTTTDFQDQGNTAETLLIVQKARGNYPHKGGTLLTPGSPADECITGWLRIDPAANVAAACQTALDEL